MWNADHRCGTRIWLGSGSAVRVSVMTRAKVGLKVRFYLAAVLHNFFAFRIVPHCAVVQRECR